ncbi:MAG: DinB family protein [Spirosoma sp.]|nr:DinB family protein [Spirosoma sp.]
MTVHFFSTLLFISLSGTAFAQPSPYLTEMAEQWKNSATYILDVAEQMPDSGYAYKPVADEMRFDEQLLHIASNMLWLSSTHLTTQKPPFTDAQLKQLAGKPKSEIIATLRQSLAFAQLAMENLPIGELDQTVKFFAGPKTKRQIINLMHDHLTHHRAQTIVYLRLNGIKPPSYVGW